MGVFAAKAGYTTVEVARSERKQIDPALTWFEGVDLVELIRNLLARALNLER